MVQEDFIRRDAGGVPFYSCAALEELRFLRHGFSTRHGGVSPLPEKCLNLSHVPWDAPEDVAENRRRFLAALNLQNAHLATLSQVHSDRLHILEEKPEGRNHRLEADALGTRLEGVAVAVQVADCFPILLADPRTKVIAAVHAGWRGMLARIFSKTVTGLREAFGVDPGDLIVAIGPGIRYCCFEVGRDVVDRFGEEYHGVRLSRPHPTRNHKYLLDLRQALEIQSEESGLVSDNVFDLDACTRCNTGEFFSYRGEGPRSGRLMGLIAQVPET